MTVIVEQLDVEPLPPAPSAWYLTGATASGKSKVALELASQIDAEIVSLDSMALYREMDIGTAKPSWEDRQRVPHHLLDIVEPNCEYSLSEYVAAAHAAVREINSRGKQALFVGGTPLYLKSLLRGLYQGPPADWEFRQQIETELQTLPIEALHERLQIIDPLAAAKLHPRDKRRIIRALEVFRLTGLPLSHRQVQFEEGRPAERCRVFVLAWPRPILHQRISMRVDQMFAAGLVAEVQSLIEKYRTLSRTALQAVGYNEVVEFLQGTQPSESECRERVKAGTRQFARRQETWFHSLSECTFVPLREEQQPSEIAAEIAALGMGREITS